METALIIDARKAVADHRSDTGAMARSVFSMVRAQMRRAQPKFAAAVLPESAPPAVKQMLSAMGIAVWRASNDQDALALLGGLNNVVLSGHAAAVIASHDTAALQLLGRRTQVVDLQKGDQVDMEYLEKKFGLRPEQVPDFMAIMSASELAGAHIGSATAISWLNTHGTLDALLSSAEAGRENDWLGKSAETLRQRRDTYSCHSRTLSINGLTDILIQPENSAVLSQIGEAHNIQVGANDEVVAQDHSESAARWIRTAEEAKAILLKDTKSLVLDATTLRSGEATALFIRTRCGATFAVDLADRTERAAICAVLKPVIEDPQCSKAAWNTKPIIKAMLLEGMEMDGLLVDGLVVSSIGDPDAKIEDVERAADHVLGRPMARLKGDIRQSPKTNLEAVTQRLGLVHELCSVCYRQLKVNESVRRTWLEFERPLIPVLARMEIAGMAVDAGKLKAFEGKMKSTAQRINKAILALDGVWHGFDPGNTNDVSKYLYSVANLPVLQKTANGSASTAEEALRLLADKHPAPKLIVQYRKASNILRSSIEPLLARIEGQTDSIAYVHAGINQHRARTSRLSTNDPNLHGTPAKGLLGEQMRECFVAPHRRKVVVSDLSQIELRILAHLSGDEKLIDAFRNGLDIHKATAAEVFGVELAAVTEEMRASAKAINFGLIYGLSPAGLAGKLGTTRDAAERYIETYFVRYPSVKKYLDETVMFARQHGYVETLAGRQIPIPNINSADANVRRSAERQAKNAPMQGTAAEIVKRAMLDISAAMANKNLNGTLHMQVHDELVLSAEIGCERDVARELTYALEHPLGFNLSVPLVAETGIGDNWLTAKKCLEPEAEPERAALSM